MIRLRVTRMTSVACAVIAATAFAAAQQRFTSNVDVVVVHPQSTLGPAKGTCGLLQSCESGEALERLGEGKPVVLSHPATEYGRALTQIAGRLAQRISIQTIGQAQAARGAGLVEIVLAMVIFAFIATSYAAISLRYATRMRVVAAGAPRSAALSEYLNRLISVPYASVDAQAGTFTTSTGDFPNTRTITVSTSGLTKTVTLILTPTNTAIKPDTIECARNPNFALLN